MERKLKIYRASAGSGKTFTLALEYMKLLIEDPHSYRNILAVTFTNKATGEMKERILSKLYGVANGSGSAKDYLDKLCKELPHLTEDTIVRNAHEALNLILHDYGHFRIQTIDAFFQTVLRSLAKELGLNGDMEISLEGEDLLDNAVDTYIRSLEPDTQNIAQVIDFIEHKLSNGSDWHVNKDLKDFAKNILREEYQQRGEELRRETQSYNGAVLAEFHKNVTSYRRKLTETAKSIGEQFFTLTQGYSAEDFHGKNRGLWGIFTKLANGDVPALSATISGLAENPGKISKVFDNVEEIAQLIRQAEPLHREKNNCDLSLKHFHQLSMLNNIAATLKEENERENRFLLAETTHLLSSMIGMNTTFIFEKIGTEIDHIFIDEFQDTSKLQWTCFKVLLDEVLARGNFNLIVGDVKQSIYRWRNSDWNIMNNISSYFRNGLIAFADQSIKSNGKEFSSVNFRSDSNIISFNNALYRTATDFISNNYCETLGERRLRELVEAYKDVEQALPAWKEQCKGYAEIRIVPKANKKENFKSYAISQLMSTLHKLLDEERIEPGNITILLRYKNAMPDIVEAFNKEFPDTKIVSDEAYRLSSSLTLQLVISSMRYIAAPDDRINIANLAGLYNKFKNNESKLYDESFSYEGIVEMLPAEFREELAHLQGLPVYELIEQLLRILGMSEEKNEEAYIYTFLDYATLFLNSKTSDLNGFIESWDETICDKSIPAEQLNSVRLMTIHKSKGLEFHTVIVPMCDWLLTGDVRNSLWCEPAEAPFNTLSLLSVPMKKEMLNSIYSDDYNKEMLYQLVDNLNILYVATTRAKSNLFIFSDGSDGIGDTVSKMLNKITKDLTALDGSEFTDGVFTYGKIAGNATRKENTVNDNPFEANPISVRQPFVHHENRITFRQSRELARFLATDKEEKVQFRNIAEGELLHLVMSGINEAGDLKKVLDKLTIEGLIATEKQYSNIYGLVVRALSNPKAKEWFCGKYRLYNECSILIGDNDESARRPDRVMISGKEAVVVDYKFARENPDHKQQVQRYMELLSRMGYENVRGYLWYVYKNDIKDVEL